MLSHLNGPQGALVAIDLLLVPLVPRLFEPPANSATRVQLGSVTRDEVTVGVRNDLSADGLNVPTNVPSIGMSALLYEPPHLYEERHGRTPFGVSQVKRCLSMRDWQDHGRTLWQLARPHREADIIREHYLIGDQRRAKRTARLSGRLPRLVNHAVRQPSARESLTDGSGHIGAVAASLTLSD